MYLYASFNIYISVINYNPICNLFRSFRCSKRIKIKKKYETYYPEEKGGIFYSYLKNFKSIKKIDIYIDSLDLKTEEIVNFSSEFIFGFNLKSYTFDIYKCNNIFMLNGL